MAASIYDLSTTAASNATVDGTDVSGATGKVKDGDNVMRSLAAFMAQELDDLGAVNTVAGTGDAITVTLSSGIAAYATGQIFRFIASAANTTNVTINVNSIGAKAVRKISGGTDVALVAGDLAAGETYTVVYRSTANSAAGAWVLVGSAAFAFSKGADIASAGTISISTASNFYHVTGTTTITDIDFSPATNGSWAWLEFDGVLTLTNNSTTLTLPGGANITTAAGDRALFVQDNGDNVHCMAYTRAATKPDKDYELVASLSASASSSINFDSSNSITIADGYDYIIKCIEVKPSADCSVAVQYGTGGTPTYQTTGYTQQASTQFNVTTNTVRDGITTGIQVTTGMGGASAGETFDAEITITRPGANSIHKMWSTFVGFATDGLINTAFTGGWRSTAEVLTGIRISPSTGNFTTGTFALYRRKVA